MSKEKADTNHRMGKYTGYDVVDGGYRIAPRYEQQFDECNYREAGIKQLINSVLDHANNEMASIMERRQKLFEELADDIGIDLTSGNWSYGHGVLKKSPDTESEKH